MIGSLRYPSSLRRAFRIFRAATLSEDSSIDSAYLRRASRISGVMYRCICLSVFSIGPRVGGLPLGLGLEASDSITLYDSVMVCNGKNCCCVTVLSSEDQYSGENSFYGRRFTGHSTNIGEPHLYVLRPVNSLNGFDQNSGGRSADSKILSDKWLGNSARQVDVISSVAVGRFSLGHVALVVFLNLDPSQG